MSYLLNISESIPFVVADFANKRRIIIRTDQKVRRSELDKLPSSLPEPWQDYGYLRVSREGNMLAIQLGDSFAMFDSKNLGLEYQGKGLLHAMDADASTIVYSIMDRQGPKTEETFYDYFLLDRKIGKPKNIFKVELPPNTWQALRKFELSPNGRFVASIPATLQNQELNAYDSSTGYYSAFLPKSLFPNCQDLSLNVANDGTIYLSDRQGLYRLYTRRDKRYDIVFESGKPIDGAEIYTFTLPIKKGLLKNKK